MAKDKSEFDRAWDYAKEELRRVGSFDKLPHALQIFRIIESAQGIIDNGGLQYFFESDFVGQPPYSTFVDAYRAIGADDAANTLAAAVAPFPFADAHKFELRRQEFLERFLDDKRHRPDSPFEPYTDKLYGNEEVWRLLEQYVRKHAAAFGFE